MTPTSNHNKNVPSLEKIMMNIDIFDSYLTQDRCHALSLHHNHHDNPFTYTKVLAQTIFPHSKTIVIEHKILQL